MEIIIFFLRGKFEKLNENYEKYGSTEELDKIELLLLLFYIINIIDICVNEIVINEIVIIFWWTWLKKWKINIYERDWRNDRLIFLWTWLMEFKYRFILSMLWMVHYIYIFLHVHVMYNLYRYFFIFKFLINIRSEITILNQFA